MLSVAFILLVVLSWSSVLGEVELVCPRPVNKTANAITYTEFTPGPRTIVFRETRAIEGSPFRISILRNGQDCVILDHIPWQRGNSMYYVTVNIPDYNCDQVNDGCELQVQQIDTASSNGYCTLDKCNTYKSSTAILIKRPGGQTGCPNRRNNYNLYNWPYDPVRRYISTMTNSSTTARGTGTFRLIGKTILYMVNVTVPFTDLQPETVRFLYYPSVSADPMVLSSVTFPSGEMGVLGSWTEVSDFAAFVFRNLTMYVQVIASGNSNSGQILGRITQSGQNGVDDVYGLEYGTYADSGWLAGEVFVGAGANATLFTQPHGPCVKNTTRHFGCMLSGSSRGGGTVGMSLTGSRLWFSVDMYNLSSAISSVAITGSTIDDLDLTPFWSNGYRLRGLTDVSDDTRLFLTSGSASVRISTSGNSRELSCSLDEGIIAILDSFYEVPAVTVSTNGSATAFLYFSVDGSVNYQITLNSLTSTLTAGHVHGPAYQGISTSNIPLDISEFITGEMNGGWNIQGTWRNLSANELKYFLDNLYYLNMHTEQNPNGELRGQVSAVGDWLCPSTDQLINQCYWLQFDVVSGAKFESGRVPVAIGGVTVDRYQRLQYSLAFWYIPMNEELTVMLSSPSGNLQMVSVTSNDDSDIGTNIREVYSVYPPVYDEILPASELQQIENGELWFNVTSTSYPSGLMSTRPPPLARSKCPGTPFNVSVGGDDGWVPTGNEYPSMRVLQEDTLTFTFSSPDNLYEMENQNRLAGCVFTPSTATLLADAETVSPNTYYYLLRDTGYNYFSSSASCQNQKMRLTTYTVGSVPTSDRLSRDVCTRSLYSYSEEQRSSSSSGLAGAITATVLGLVFGIVIAAVAIVIGVYVMFKGRISGSSEDLPKP